jgi:hypothetical protein
MTLAEWAKGWPHKVSQHSSGAMWTPDGELKIHHRCQAFYLSDYLVSSVSGGSIWFVSREPSTIQTCPMCSQPYAYGRASGARESDYCSLQCEISAGRD